MMKNIFLKLFLFSILLAVGVSLYSQKAISQTKDALEIYTDGYSMLGPSAFVFLGGYYDNTGSNNFTTYFEYRKDNRGIKYDSDDLLNYFNLNKDVQETIKMDHSKALIKQIALETGDFDISAELNLFSTYYFRAVGYVNDNPEKKYYGSTFSIRTGYIPPGWSVPFTVRAGDTEVVEPFDPTSVLPGTFASDITATTVTISGILYNKNPENLNIKVAYGEEEYDFDSDNLIISRDGKFSVTLKNLKPKTSYYFVLWDTRGVLKTSVEGSFTTLPNALPVVSASDIIDTSATIKVIFERKDVIDDRIGKRLNLKVEYGKSNFDLTSDSMTVVPRGATQVEASITLKDLTPNTGYYFRLIDVDGRFEPSPQGRFATLKKGLKTPEPKIQITSTVYNIDHRSVLIRANVYNADPSSLELRVYYGVGEMALTYDRELDAYRYNSMFTKKSNVMQFDDSGNASVTLSDLEPNTKYNYTVTEKDNFEADSMTMAFPVFNQTFITMSERDSRTPIDEGDTTEGESAEPTGWVECTKDCGVEDFIKLINKMIRIILYDLSVPFAAIMFAYAGFQVLTAGPNVEKRGQALNTFKNIAIGLVLVATAFLIIQTVLFILLAPEYYSTLNFFEFVAP